MMPKNKSSLSSGDDKEAGPGNTPVEEAHIQAEEDIKEDPELGNIPAKEDDLDEGELARLEGED
ncbi:MAG: hypothetical protein ABJA57_05725 [Ginsengibacter sp.]